MRTIRRLIRLIRWYKDPFIVKHDYYEHTHIEHRVFPYRLRITRVPSAQECLDKGGLVQFPQGTFHLTEALVVTQPHTTIIGAYLQNHNPVDACLRIPYQDGKDQKL